MHTPDIAVRKKMLHDLRGVAHALFLIETAALRREEQGTLADWDGIHAQVFSQDGAALVSELIRQLGYQPLAGGLAPTPRAEVQGFLRALREHLPGIIATEKKSS